MAAVRPPLNGDRFDLNPEETQRIHEQQLVSMFQSFQLEASDLEELREKLKEEGCSPERIEAQVQEHAEKVRKLTSEPIPTDTLKRIVEDYRQSLRSTVARAGLSAIENLKRGFHWDERNSAELSVRIWFDATTDIRALKNGAKQIQELADLTVAQEVPVFEESERVIDRNLVEGQIRALAERVDASFNRALEQYPMPSRVVIEWKLACPDENRETYQLVNEIPLIRRESVACVIRKINPSSEKG